MISSSELNKNDYKYKQYYSKISELIDFEINNKEIDWEKIYRIIEIIFNFMHEEREFNRRFKRVYVINNIILKVWKR